MCVAWFISRRIRCQLPLPFFPFAHPVTTQRLKWIRHIRRCPSKSPLVTLPRDHLLRIQTSPTWLMALSFPCRSAMVPLPSIQNKANVCLSSAGSFSLIIRMWWWQRFLARNAVKKRLLTISRGSFLWACLELWGLTPVRFVVQEIQLCFAPLSTGRRCSAFLIL